MAKFFTPSKISENIRETPEGYLVCLGVPIARTGWQDYGPGECPIEPGEDGKTWIYRDSKEVFHPYTIASFQGKPITIRHPQDFVKPANWKELSFGTVQNVRKGSDVDENGEEQLLADFLVTDEMAIGLIRNGLREVSCGYDADYVETKSGEGKQVSIVGNHVALVETGRAGSSYAIRDHAGNKLGEESFMKKTLKDLGEQLKALVKTVDEAAEEKPAPKKGEDADAMDALVKAVSDLSAKVDAMAKGKDEEKPAEKPAAKKEEKPADDEEPATEGDSKILARLEQLEAAVAKMLKKGGEDEEEESEDEDEYMDEEESEEESEDAVEGAEVLSGDEAPEEKEEKKTGDAARIETLTPGKKFKGKDSRKQCLAEFSKTESGAKLLKKLSSGKKPTLDSKENIDMLFMAASTIMKTKRTSGLESTKNPLAWSDGHSADDNAPKAQTAEQMNEINAKHYGLAK